MEINQIKSHFENKNLKCNTKPIVYFCRILIFFNEIYTGNIKNYEFPNDFWGVINSEMGFWTLYNLTNLPKNLYVKTELR